LICRGKKSFRERLRRFCKVNSITKALFPAIFNEDYRSNSNDDIKSLKLPVKQLYFLTKTHMIFYIYCTEDF